MNKTVIGFVMFAAGTIIGSVATWQYAKNKYDKLAQEEINAVKEVYRKRENKLKKEYKDDAEKKAYKEIYTDIANNYGYQQKNEAEHMTIDANKPYVISPEEFSDIWEYDTISLTYYADKVLTDDEDEVIEDIEGTVGAYSLERFGEYEDDAVYVRNDRLKCYYEILKDLRNYSDVISRY